MMYAFIRVDDRCSSELGCDHIGENFELWLRGFQIDSIRLLLDSFFRYRYAELAFERGLEEWQLSRILHRVGSFVLGYFDW